MQTDEAFETWIREFELAWQQHTPPSIVQVLASARAEAASSLDESRLLLELIAVDLEYCWRLHSEGATTTLGARIQPKRIAEYAAEIEELKKTDSIQLELIGEEYRVRQLWGDQPGHPEFLDRYPSDPTTLGALLDKIDRDLCDEEIARDIRSKNRSAISRDFEANGGIDPQAPLLYSDYVLEKQIGAGGMGKVYRAKQKSIGKLVAAKFLRKRFIDNSQAVARFVEEAKTVAKLRHHGIVGVHGLGRTPYRGYFIVMDFIDGPDLGRLINERPVTPAEAIGWVAAVAEAIQYAHECGIVHCDLKPSNILLDHDGRVLITDFGLARSTNPAEGRSSEFAGTAGFMAPEQIDSNWGPIGPKTDVYGLGAVLHALLTGEPPFSGVRAADVFAQIVSQPPRELPSSILESTSSQLNEICQRCLSKQPDSRYQTARELAAELNQLLLQLRSRQ
jgi:tRNA A-37 threonylcarbamoyl transferase component Bud32